MSSAGGQKSISSQKGKEERDCHSADFGSYFLYGDNFMKFCSRLKNNSSGFYKEHFPANRYLVMYLLGDHQDENCFGISVK